MKVFHWALGSVVVLLLLFILLVTSVEATVYWNPHYFEKKYEKYHVAESVQMEMSHLLDVTDEMMGYLRDKRENLDILTVINGEERAFFNDREKAHMADVKALFLKAEMLRKWFLVAVILGILFFIKEKKLEILCRAVRGIVLGVCGVSLCLAVLVSKDFYQYFTIFHKIFFHNNLWILYPETDLLISIVPEPFFIDTAIWVFGFFCMGMMVLFLLANHYLLMHRKKRNKKNRG